MTNLFECSRCNKKFLDEEYDQHECMPEIKRWKTVKFTHYYISESQGKKYIGIRCIDGTKYDFEEIPENKDETKIPYQTPNLNTEKNYDSDPDNLPELSIKTLII